MMCSPLRTVIIAFACALLAWDRAEAQAQTDPAQWQRWAEISIGAGGIVSIQPSGSDSPPYVIGALGGVEPGLSGSLTLVKPRGFVFQIEVGTTTSMSRMQEGRAVAGTGQVLAEHRDTIVSPLFGYQARGRRSAVEVKGGLSVVLAQSRQGALSVDHRQPEFAATGAASIAGQLVPHVSLVPSVMYLWFPRERSEFLAIGQHIVRIGLSVRYDLIRP